MQEKSVTKLDLELFKDRIIILINDAKEENEPICGIIIPTKKKTIHDTITGTVISIGNKIKSNLINIGSTIIIKKVYIVNIEVYGNTKDYFMASERDVSAILIEE